MDRMEIKNPETGWTRQVEIEQIDRYGYVYWATVTAFNPAAEKPLMAERTYKGNTYVINCYVTEDLVEQYQAGKLQIGDFVTIIFVDGDSDKPLATQKVHKTW